MPFDPLSLITGGASLAGDIYSAHRQSREGEKARQYQTDMSNTAHQRQVADLKKAGLNPILSAGGGGASTPSSSATQLPKIDAASAVDKFQTGKKINNETAATVSNIKTQDTQQKLNASAASKNVADATLALERVKSESGKAAVSSTIGKAVDTIKKSSASKHYQSFKKRNSPSIQKRRKNTKQRQDAIDKRRKAKRQAKSIKESLHPFAWMDK